MAFHIVTNRCFLACDKVTSVIVEELEPERIRPKRKKKKKSIGKSSTLLKTKATQSRSKYAITICYYPLAQKNSGTNNSNSPFYNNNNSSDESSIEVIVFNKKDAMNLYAEIVKEVQEQHPGEGYLDKLVTKLLLGEEFKA